jgi:hypothetical protein
VLAEQWEDECVDRAIANAARQQDSTCPGRGEQEHAKPYGVETAAPAQPEQEAVAGLLGQPKASRHPRMKAAEHRAWFATHDRKSLRTRPAARVDP